MWLPSLDGPESGEVWYLWTVAVGTLFPVHTLYEATGIIALPLTCPVMSVNPVSLPANV